MAKYDLASEHIVVQTAPPNTEPKPQWRGAVLLALVAVATYLSVPLAPGGRLLVPSVATVVLMPLLFLTVRRQLSTGDQVFVLKIAFVLLVSIAFSPGYVYVIEKFKSLLQCVMALTVTVMTVRLMRQVRPDLLERTFFLLWTLILVGSVLEVLGVTRTISDAFRVWAYDAVYTLYTAEDRDVNLVGWLRPNLFSEEPSHVTRFFLVTINCWLLVKVTRLKVAAVAAATAGMLVIMGSPTLFVSAAITVAILVWDPRIRARSKAAMIVSAAVVGVIFVAFYGASTFSNVVARLDRIGEAATAEHSSRLTSEGIRTVIPYSNLVRTLSRWPLFGVGIGGKEIVVEESPLPKSRGLNSIFGTNAMAEYGTLLGVLGAPWFIYLLVKQMSRTGVQRLGLLLVFGALFSQLQAGIDGFRYWGFIALFWGAVAVADTKLTMQKKGGASVNIARGSTGSTTSQLAVETASLRAGQRAIDA